ncbi:MAG: ABC transporter substrate-binding protein [Caulobacterales bacterium]|nr:ABC transporter substrate-binding protein [Caulobacterales bacterium]
MNANIRIIDAGGAHEHVTIAFMRAARCFEQVDVRVERTLVTNGAEAVTRLLANQADAAIQVGCGPALAAIADGAPLRLIAGANLLTVHAIYSKDGAIRAIEDLRGRAVGVGALGALTHQLAYAALLKRGVDPSAVRFMPIGNSAKIFQALLAGEIDAGFGETDVFEHQAQYGVHALEGGVLWRELPEFLNQASFARLDVIENKRDALVRTLAAHALLYRRLQARESWAAFADAWRIGLPQAPLEEGQSQWRFYQQSRPFAEDLRLPEERVTFLQALNVKMGRQQGVLPFATVSDVTLAQDALRLIEH